MENPFSRIHMLEVGLSIFIGLGLSVGSFASEPVKPNVVIIYGDDVGFADVGVNGSKMIPTPNIDRLAAKRVNFTDGHCTASTCTPSRFSLMTGIHAFRYKARILPPNAPLIIPTDKPTLATLFGDAGYATGIVGKWHLGIGEEGTETDWNGVVKPGPLELGFDYSFLIPSTNDRVPTVYLNGHHVVNLDPKDPLFVSRKLEDVRRQKGSTQYPDGMTNREAMTYYESSKGHNNSVINGIGRIGYMAGGHSALWNDETITDVLVDEAEHYIEKHKSRPFFLFFSSPDIHVPRTPHPRFQGTTKLGYRGDAMVQFDWAVGQIMDSLDKHGLTENTIVIFSSDNGPTYDDGYLDGTTVVSSSRELDRGHDASGMWRGGKGQIYEAGTRIPLIIRWPAKITGSTTSRAMVSQVDFMASFADLLGETLADDVAIDSRNTLSAFLGEDSKGLDYLIEEGFNLALRSGDWKYVEPTLVKAKDGKRVPLEESLFNLAADPMEQRNLIAQYPEKVARLKVLLGKLKTGEGLRKELK